MNAAQLTTFVILVILLYIFRANAEKIILKIVQSDIFKKHKKLVLVGSIIVIFIIGTLISAITYFLTS